jgi:hypothetical protein
MIADPKNQVIGLFRRRRQFVVNFWQIVGPENRWWLATTGTLLTPETMTEYRALTIGQARKSAKL